MKAVDDILGQIDAGSIVALVRLNISPAFDIVNHTTMLTRLVEDFCITGQMLQWISSYLYSRCFCVQVGPSSAGISCQAGVPRGSVLGPILFTMYMSPIECIINSHGVGYCSYVDVVM